MAEEKKVTLRLDVGMSPGAKKSIDDLSNATKKAADEQGRLNKNIEATGKTAGTYGMAPVDAKPRGPSPHIEEAMRRGGAIATRRANDAKRRIEQEAAEREAVMGIRPKGSGSGMVGSAAGGQMARAATSTAGLVAAPATAAATAMQTTADFLYGAQAAYDVGGTLGDSYRAGVNSNFLTRNTLGLQMEFMDSISGRQYGIDRARREGGMSRVELTMMDQRNTEARNMETQRRIGQFGIDAIGNAPMAAGVGGMDRTTLEGETAYRERAARQGIENQLNVVTGDRGAAQRRVEEIQRRREEAEARTAKFRNEALDAGIRSADGKNSADERTRADEQEKTARARLNQSLDEERDLINQEKEARQASVEMLQREKQLRMQLAEITLREMQQREATAASQASRLGGMDDFAAGRAIDAFEQLQGLSPEQLRNASPFLLGEAQKVAPETLRKMQEEAGKNSPAQQRLRQLAPGEFRDNLDDIRKQAQDAADKLQIEIRLNEKEIREEMQKAINPKEFADKFLEIFNERISAILAEMRREKRMEHLGGG